MNLKRISKDGFRFQLGRREKRLLGDLLKLYPTVPASHLPVSKTGNLPDKESSQKLLEEVLAQQRAENKRQLENLLTDPARWSDSGDTCELSLSEAEIDWLLQVLNDIRVGSWVRLGCPEERLEVLNEKMASYLYAMEMAGCFQMYLIHALDEDG